MNPAVITGLYVYPIKSCRGVQLDQAKLCATGLANDRRWMLVNDKDVFITQREQARLALIAPQVQGEGLLVTAPGMAALTIDGQSSAQRRTVTVWRDKVSAFDEGEAVAAWFSAFLGLNVRLVRFDDAQPRISSRDFTGDIEAHNRFSDGFPLLVIATASLADLNSRLATPVPMQRFRPNIVVEALPAYGEDAVHELHSDTVALRLVKPCTRCKITTIDPDTGVSQGTEPLSTLMKYRRNPTLRGVTFGQNAIVLNGVGQALSIGQSLRVTASS